MIKLPKEVVMQLAGELETLVKDRDTVVTQEDIDNVVQANNIIEDQINQKQAQINALNEEIKGLKLGILPIPEIKHVDEERIDALSQMLVLSGYFKKVVGEDGEYLEETGAYNEQATEEVITEPLAAVLDNIETAEEAEPVTIEEATPIYLEEV